MNCCKKSKRSKREEPLEYGVSLELQSENILETSASPDETDQRRKEKDDGKERKGTFEKDLLETIINYKDEQNFEDIEETITPRALSKCESSSLLMGMKVSFQLRRLADKRGADEDRFNHLANTVEAFTYTLLDPLRSNKELREEFGFYVLDHIIDDAIDLDQKKFFTHAAVEEEMNRKFRGRFPWKGKWNWWQLLLFRLFCFWCAIDLLIVPILFTAFLMRKKRRGRPDKEGAVANLFLLYSSPNAKYFRDTLSYAALVLLHYALCLSPSTIVFSRLEWAILIFFVGRYLVESQQIWNIMQRIKQRRKDGEFQSNWICLETLSIYLSDPWNLLDFISLLVYLIVFTLRMITWLTSGSEINNRSLAIAGYLYSFNTLCLTLRVFGYVTEQSRHLGVIQIALFGILKDISTIVLQFVAGILAFSIAITKVYMAGKSFTENGNARNDNTCKTSGLACWWAIVTHLGWSLLGQSDKSDPMASVDFPSETVARILYAAFLIFGVILLLNMLIALLCNTFQRTEDNSFKVWSMKRAITIQTYDAYDPVPVPLNIIYNIVKLLSRLGRRKDKKEEYKKYLEKKCLGRIVTDILERKYFAKHTNLFPVIDEDKVDRVLHETENNRQMVSQILNTTFQSQDSEQRACVGPEMWQVHQGIRQEGLLLTCECEEQCARTDIQCRHGARYRQPLSSEFPYFEVVILETGERWLGIGVVNKHYNTSKMPGWKSGSVGYHTDDGIIFHHNNQKQTKGPVMARRGDRIRCTVMFENKKVSDRKIQVLFSLNGRKIVTKEGEDQFLMASDKLLYPYIGMLHGCSVLAKMCPREVCKTEDLDSKVTKSLEKTNRKLKTLLAVTADVKEEHDVSRLQEHYKQIEKVWESLEETNQKLDALLESLIDIKKDLQNAKACGARL